MSATVTPADPDLIPEARAVLAYFDSIHGQRTLTAANSLQTAEATQRTCGRAPAIAAFDLSGWNSPAWGADYQASVRRTVADVFTWARTGGIVSLQLHWINPLNPDGSAWKEKHGKKPASPPFPFAAALQDGTPEHAALMRDLSRHADILAEFAAARIPVLWRPFHEIEGGWFWWTDSAQPENSAALWRLMFDYFVKERKLHNLIWVYASAVRCGTGPDAWANLAQRRRFYPGAAYVDLAGIDIYPNPRMGYGPPQTDTYAKAHALLQELAPGKMLTLAECQSIPDPARMAATGPRWLYCLPWWEVGEKNPADWLKQVYAHELMVTREQLPAAKTRP